MTGRSRHHDKNSKVGLSDGAGRARPSVTHLAHRAMRLEKHMYASIWRAVARRPALPPGATGHRYDKSSLLVLGVLIVVSAIEIVVIDLIVHQWFAVRVAFLLLGVWGLIWMIGLLCAHVMRPHAVGPDGIRVRDGLDLDLALAWDDVHSVGIRRRTYDHRPPRVLDEGEDRILLFAIQAATNIEVVYDTPMSVSLPGKARGDGEVGITKVRFWADDPTAFLATVKRHLTPPTVETAVTGVSGTGTRSILDTGAPEPEAAATSSGAKS